ncbi:iron complex transport system permease protein [Streptosporangium becharense]|uniref:Iron complex transport system permease protein n=1 Tax=Streptosporangium becharense TaxID=1816182 RepID=A0A7W9MFX6_9ACTN|nr:iron chelate uptake ABC transporter family permease subunit [Streptosporangium becharense]MBB2912317.1 iron complex transport system permease protein [Streptosporangium becharense]MBB5818864.1 iron complex transport system permease protein [Streptosporangium becharense]
MSAYRTVRTPSRRISLRIHLRAATVVLGLLSVAAVVGLLALGTGSAISPWDAVKTLLGQGDGASEMVVYEVRAPRVLLALLVGAALGVGGAVVQSLSRNPLGSPDIVGVNAGAAAGAVAVILLVDAATALAVATGSLLCGLAASLLVYALSFKRGVQGNRLVLVGIGVTAMLHSFIAYLLTRADLYESQGAKVWLVGSLAGAGWERVWPVAVAVTLLLPMALVLSRSLRAMEMGDDTAAALGLSVERHRLALLVVAVVLSGVAVSAAGPVSFVALAAPQLARRLTRAPGAGVAAGAVTGAVLLATADLVAQRLPTTGQLPVGVLTGGLGGLYLAWLLHREWRAGRS